MAPMTFLGSITTPLSWPTTLTMPHGSLPSMQTGKSVNRAPEQSLERQQGAPLTSIYLMPCTASENLLMPCILGLAR